MISKTSVTLSDDSSKKSDSTIIQAEEQLNQLGVDAEFSSLNGISNLENTDYVDQSLVEVDSSLKEHSASVSPLHENTKNLLY